MLKLSVMSVHYRRFSYSRFSCGPPPARISIEHAILEQDAHIWEIWVKTQLWNKPEATTIVQRPWKEDDTHLFFTRVFFVCRTTKLLWNTWVRSRNFRHQPWKFRDSKPNWCPSWHRTRSHRLHSQRQHSATYGGGHGMSMKIHHPRAEECWGIASPFPQFYLSCKWV